jgi:chitin disaccharide deacetylase
MKRQLIVSADDFGLTERINQAILIAHREGVVTSASLMVNGQAMESAASIAKQHASLDVGLHLNLTEGQSVSSPDAIPSLANQAGFLYDHPFKLWVALRRGDVRPSDVEVESRAQLQKALDSGVEITHVDGHKHVHAVPLVLDFIRRIAPAYGVKAVRSTIERTPCLVSFVRRNGAARYQVIKQYLSGLAVSNAFWMTRRRRGLNGLVTPSWFYGVTQTGFLDADAFADIIRDLPPGVSEVMCHPGYVDADLERTPTRLLSQRERELKVVTRAEARELIAHENVELIGYRDLVRDHGSSEGHSILDRCSAV